jgi:CheY-like chemotaxis protein
LIRKLRSQPAWAEVPIIVISGTALPEDQAAALRAGANAFLPKPFSRQELRSAIRPFIPAIAPILYLPADIHSAA